MNNIKSMLIFAIVISMLCANTLYISAATVSKNNPTSVNLEVNNRLHGDQPPSKETFTYIVTAVDHDSPLPSETKASIEGTGTVGFGTITFTVPGIYEYTLVQKANKAEYYTYDDTIYEIKVIVRTDATGVLTPEMSVIKQGETLKAENLLFVNSYKAPVITEGESGTQEDEKSPSTNVETGSNSSDSVTGGPLPKTGDEAKPFWVVVLAIATVGCTWIILMKRKQKTKDKEQE